MNERDDTSYLPAKPVRFTATNGSVFTVTPQGREIIVQMDRKDRSPSTEIIYMDGKRPRFLETGMHSENNEAISCAAIIIASMQKGAHESLRVAAQNIVEAVPLSEIDGPPEERNYVTAGHARNDVPVCREDIEHAFDSLISETELEHLQLKALKARSTLSARDGREVLIEQAEDVSNPLHPVPAQMMLLELSDAGPICQRHFVYELPQTETAESFIDQRYCRRTENGEIEMMQSFSGEKLPPETLNAREHEDGIVHELALVLSAAASARKVSGDTENALGLEKAADHIRTYLARDENQSLAHQVRDAKNLMDAGKPGQSFTERSAISQSPSHSPFR